MAFPRWRREALLRIRQRRACMGKPGLGASLPVGSATDARRRGGMPGDFARTRMYPETPYSSTVHEKESKAKEQLSDQVAEQWRLLTARNKEGKLFAIALSAHGGMLWGAGLIVAVGVFLFVFREPLKADTVKGTADVAKRVISEKKVQDEALEATKAIVSEILRDDPSLDLLVNLLKNLVLQKETQVALADLIKRLFEDPHTKENVKVFVAKILMDEWIQDKVVSLANVGLHQLANDENMRHMFVDFLRTVVMSTLQDDHVQHTTGNALFNAAKMSIGLSAADLPVSQEERRLKEENVQLLDSLRKARLEVAQMNARLVYDKPVSEES